jgi:predicted RNA-binding Zn ribbon-like protein
MILDAYRFPIRVGGNLCLDFTNTVEFRDSDERIEFLRSYTSVLAWCWRSHLIDDTEAERLSALAADQPAEAESAFHTAVEFRETFHRICRAVIRSESPLPADLEFLNHILTTVQPQRRLAASQQGFAWTWVRSDDLAHILAPIALAAADLLTSNELQRVRQCPNCGWLFVDTSRNHSRRWCSMDFCGSKIKSRRQYERRKTAKI